VYSIKGKEDIKRIFFLCDFLYQRQRRYFINNLP